MHILIDVQGCQSESRFRGIGRSTLEMSRAIIRHSHRNDDRVSILINGMYPVDNVNFVMSLYNDLLPAHEMYIFNALAPTAYCNEANHDRGRAALAAREIAIANINPDIVFITSFFEGHGDNYTVGIPATQVPWKTVCVCHDLIPLLNKERYLGDLNFRAFYMSKLKEYERSDAIVAISDSAVQEVLDNTRISSDRVFNISSAAGDEFRKNDYSDEDIQRFRDTYHIPEKYILTLAMIEPRKNVEALIHAYSQLPKTLQKTYPMVLAYKVHPVDLERILKLAESYGLHREQLIFTGFLSDDDLIKLYNLASLFVFPSLHEGFGLPVLEAMKCGIPTLGSNLTSLPEVIGWSEALFDPNDIEDIVRVIERALTDDEFHGQLRAHAITQSQRFSWDKTATLAVDVFNDLLQKAPRVSPAPDYAEINRGIQSIREVGSFNDTDRLALAWAIARNSFLNQQRKLLVDISMLVEFDAKTGIQRVSRNILRELLQMEIPGYEVAAIYYQRGECYRFANRFMNREFGTRFKEEDAPVLFSKDDVMVVTDLTAHLFPELVGELDRMRLAGARACFVVHDILPIRHPEWCTEGVNRDMPVWLAALAEHADRIICVSHSVADDVRNWLEEHQAEIEINPLLKVSNFHLGADLPVDNNGQITAKTEKALLSTISSKNSFLMVGTIEPRKGHKQVLDAFDELWTQGEEVELVIVGKAGWNVEDLCKRIRQHPHFNKRLFWPKDVSDELLTELYDACSALIFASYGEGFGLPLIEAAQRNLPVIVRDIPVFREIGQQGAFFFSGLDADDIATAITQWIALYQRNEHPKPEDVHWLTWRQSAELLLEQLPLVRPENEDNIPEHAPADIIRTE